jgi:hypothetical protein
MAQHIKINKHNRTHKQNQGEKNHMIISVDAGKKKALTKFNILS